MSAALSVCFFGIINAMVKAVQVVAFEGGALRAESSGAKSREAVLALPLSRLLVKTVRVPADEDAVEYSTRVLSAMSPYPDEELTVSVEKVRECESSQIVLAAALPESSAEDIASALDEAKLSVVRIDAIVLGELRGVWSRLGAAGRKVVLFVSPDSVSIIVVDGDVPSSIRAVPKTSDLRREITLSLLEAEDFGGAGSLSEIVVIDHEGEENSISPDRIGSFAVPVRSVTIGADAFFSGIAERNLEDGTLNALPATWRDVLEETRFKRKLVGFMAVACSLWALALGVLLGVPVAYGYMTDYQKGLCSSHAREYRAVSDKRSKVKLVRKYSDHSLGALEIMKAVSDSIPDGITLTSWDFKRDEGLSIRGDSDDSAQAYELKDSIAEKRFEGDDGEEGDVVFQSVKIGALNKHKDGKQKFGIECLFTVPEE